MAKRKTVKKIKIFLASSAELKEDRDKFRNYISTLNDKFIDSKIYLEIVQWEHFLDAISPTRLQDEYNQELKTCDIALCLFFTKVGVYTEEEFNTAYSTFKASGKPKIWTYFKNSPINTGNITLEINTLLAFKKKLPELGHFYTGYENSHDLHLQFRDQLDRMLPAILIPSNRSDGFTAPVTIPVTLPPALAMPNNPKFQIFKSATNQQFYYRLKSKNGETILSGEGYTSKDSCLKGIASVKENATIDNRYERKDSTSNYTFNLKAANGEIIGRTENYIISQARENGISAVKQDAPGAMVEDLS